MRNKFLGLALSVTAVLVLAAGWVSTAPVASAATTAAQVITVTAPLDRLERRGESATLPTTVTNVSYTVLLRNLG